MKLPWFLPETPDVIGLLREQAAVTGGGLEALTEWAAGESAAAERVRESEHAADERKLALLKALTESSPRRTTRRTSSRCPNDSTP